MKLDLKKISSLFIKKHILVIGDVMIDKYLEGDVLRISPEAPVPVVEINKKFLHAGGAANVAKNISGLGGMTTLIGMVGDDLEGHTLAKIIEKDSRIDQQFIFDKSRRTSLKTRIISDNQQLIRLDYEDKQSIKDRVVTSIINKIKGISVPFDGIIIQDYNKGLLTKKLISWVMSYAKKKSIPVYIDPKDNLYTSFSGARVFKPNLKEFNHFAGDYNDFSKIAKEIMLNNKFQILLITRGNQGLSLFENGKELNIPAIIKQVHDVSGAGDTVISTFTLCDCVKLLPEESAYIANIAASIVCEIPGVAPITKDLLIEKAVKYIQ
jgi:D-glycero-beta-D-manno-heptose-7-phosphate kinase